MAAPPLEVFKARFVAGGWQGCAPCCAGIQARTDRDFPVAARLLGHKCISFHCQ